MGAALRVWRDALIADLGGEDRVSTQQRAIVDLACRTYLMLQHVDNYILGEKALVNRRSRKLHPVVLHRQRLADGLAKYLDMLGLERRGDVHDLSEYVRSKYGAED